MQIAAAAIYIICRQEDHPFMLLDFADVLQVNVFQLGSVFLQMCKIFRLEEHAIVTKQVSDLRLLWHERYNWPNYPTSLVFTKS